MITNLFSIFDPSTKFIIPLNWLSIIIFIIFIPLNFWLNPNRINILYNKILNIINKEFNSILIINKNIKFKLIFNSLFLFILINNFIGLFPYIFTRTRHISINLSIAFRLWLRIFLYGWLFNRKKILIHLLPLNTPIILIPFIIIIEIIRLLIRPITLTIRLTANIIAGHILLSLLRNLRTKIPIIVLPINLIIQIILILLEIAVSIIQSYVFVILITLYTREI